MIDGKAEEAANKVVVETKEAFGNEKITYDDISCVTVSFNQN